MPPLLLTDTYKFPMQEAGFPLRRETFVTAFRKGGWMYNPYNLPAVIKAMLPTASEEDFTYLAANGMTMSGAYRAAVTKTDDVRVRAIPQGGWFFEREPLNTVTGTSALASWPEPLVLRLSRGIQIATAYMLDPGSLRKKIAIATCEEEAEITREVFRLMEEQTGISYALPEIKVMPEAYYNTVLARARRLVDLVEDPAQLFEVGMRAASCEGQHEIALQAIKDAGVTRTSNTYLARKLGMVPVGTMGHEHIQRYGSSYAAFVAMRDRVSGFVFYLPDTYNTLREGVPSALQAMAFEPSRNSGIRFDTEKDRRNHYLTTVRNARLLGLDPYLALEASWDDTLTAEYEALRKEQGWKHTRQGYGIGNFFVQPEWEHYRRDDVSAVYKLSETGGIGRSKLGDEPGAAKESIPGRPEVWRANMDTYTGGPISYICQEGEDVPSEIKANFIPLFDMETDPTSVNRIKQVTSKYPSAHFELSPATKELRLANYRLREANISAASVQLSTLPA